ncbi:MAG: hypothetical protein AAGD13_07335 [Pseudomonadota bacterium]
MLLELNSRKKMNSRTPDAAGGWVYHHVLPVRYYYAIACVLAHAVKTNAGGSGNDAAAALEAMPTIGANRNTIKKLAGGADIALADIGKLCASPYFGGFSGPEGVQRISDPGDRPERVCPKSAPRDWWTALKQLETLITGLVPSLPERDNEPARVSVDDGAIAADAGAIAGQVLRLSDFNKSVRPFDPGDWRFSPNPDGSATQPWHYLTGDSKLFPSNPQVDSLVRAGRGKSKKEFQDLWNGVGGAPGLSSTLGGHFKLIERLEETGGVPIEAGPQANTRAADASANLFRRVNKHLVRVRT